MHRSFASRTIAFAILIGLVVNCIQMTLKLGDLDTILNSNDHFAREFDFAGNRELFEALIEFCCDNARRRGSGEVKRKVHLAI